MSKQAYKRVRRALGLEVSRKPLDAFAWPGGYPIMYLFSDGESCCPKCANDDIDTIDEAIKEQSRDGWRLTGWFIHYEGEPETCCNCSAQTESAYGDPAEAEAAQAD